MFHKTAIKKTLLISFLLVLSASQPGTVSAGVNVWTSNGPGSGHILALAIDPATSTTLYAGTWGSGVFKSTNGGENWGPVNTGLTDAWINALVIDLTAREMHIAWGNPCQNQYGTYQLDG